ncbi:MAG TPA: hypothetical protein VLA62_10170, partial [Solirubrobacterales bacterium]|nr:hypothetical protein [Solirubrobacterales bacterium]
MDGSAIDFSNSHSRVVRWDAQTGTPSLVELPAICRRPGGGEPLEAPRLVPSATDVLHPLDWVSRLGVWAPLA